MFSVVVPTMWRYEPFLDFIDYVSRLDLVKEIIIIDNDRAKRPNHNIFQNSKLKCFDFGENIFVNPAWNYGISISTADKVCILNDDITFDLKLFYRVEDFFQPHHGTLGITNGLSNQVPITDGSITFTPFAGQNCHGYGNLFFVFRNNCPMIPKELKIWWGDVFMFEWFHFQNYHIHLIDNLFQNHAGAKTSIDFHAYGKNEPMIYDQIRAQMYAGVFDNFNITIS